MASYRGLLGLWGVVCVFDTIIFGINCILFILSIHLETIELSFSFNYATFLDLAAEARILEKDGGHWRFRHQTLQEHFAKMSDTI
jgi:hypothetical protein